MSFKDCDDVMPSGTFFSLKDDGNAEILVFAGEPIPREEKVRGKKRVRAYFPVITPKGLKVWGVGSRLYWRLRDGWAAFDEVPCLIVRHGAADSLDTDYEIKPVKITPALRREVAKVKPKDVAKLLDDVKHFGESEDSTGQSSK